MEVEGDSGLLAQDYHKSILVSSNQTTGSSMITIEWSYVSLQTPQVSDKLVFESGHVLQIELWSG